MLYTFDGKTQRLCDWAREKYCRTTYTNLWLRLSHGWTFEEALTSPHSRHYRPIINLARDKNICMDAGIFSQANLANFYGLSPQRISQIIAKGKKKIYRNRR